MPSISAVPLMTPIVIVVRCSTNWSWGIRRGLSTSEPSHQSVAAAAQPYVANAASSKAPGSSSISRSSLLNISAMASVISRPSLNVRVADSERSVGEIAAATGQSQPKISNHLACLRWCGFVATRREHRRVYYSLADTRVTALLQVARDLLEDNAEHVACCSVLQAEGR